MPIQLSVVLPTYNRIDRLQKVFTALEGQTLPLDQFEIIVVSDGSEDGTNEWLTAYSGPLHINPILQKNQGVAAARNNGYRKAVGEVVLFIDDDVVPMPHLLESHLTQQIESTSDKLIVIGPMLTPDDFDMQPWVQYEQAMLMKQYQSMIEGEWEPTARQFYTGNTSIKRAFLIESGGFDPSFRRAEDVELAYRLADMGAVFHFDPEAIGYHHAERSFRSWSNIASTYGQNDVIFSQEKNQPWLLESIFKEYFTRNILTRTLTQISLGRPNLTYLSTYTLKGMAGLFHVLNIRVLFQACYSGIYNITYYNGVASKLGGRDIFFDSVNRRK